MRCGSGSGMCAVTRANALIGNRMRTRAAYFCGNVVDPDGTRFLTVQHPLSYTFYSQAAYTHGPYVVKYRLQPMLETQTSLSSTKPLDADEYPTMIAQYFTSHPAKYSFDVQMCSDPSKQSVEDTSKEWNETEFPWETVGVVDFPVGQETASDARRVFWEDRLGSGPFEGLAAHQPLGSVNRLRKHIYPHSRKYRAARNVTEIQEILSVDDIPE